MEFSKIDLYEYFGLTRPDNGEGYLKAYNHFTDADHGVIKLRPAMLVIGGGGYGHVSSREKEPVAFEYFTNGYNVFVLEYSVAPVKYPVQLIEACMAVAYIKENAKKFCIIPDQIAGIGFSAGGHLCAMLATVYNSQVVKDALGDKAGLCKLDAVILSYPVITSGEYAHRGSFVNLCGDDQKLINELSLEKRVDINAVPAFIWATVTDQIVPSENSLLMASAYKKAGVPFELHLYAEGPHGMSVCTMETEIVPGGGEFVNPHVAKWLETSLEWLNIRGFKMQVVSVE